MTKNSFFSLLKIGIGNSFIRYFLDYKILSYVIIDSFLGFLLVNITNKAITNISLFQLAIILFLPICTSLLNIVFENVFSTKKIQVIDNILVHLKKIFENAPNEFHEKFDIREKYNSFSSSIWGYDHVIQLIINMMSSLIKIITISATISYNDRAMAMLIIVSNLIMLYIMPKINNKIENMKQYKINYKELYSTLYYETVIYDELRVNPILNNIYKDNINNCLSNIVLKYSNQDYYHNVGVLIGNVIKNTFLMVIFMLVYYQNKTEYILILLLNKDIIFGFSNLYVEFKQSENNSKKRMEELLSMLEYLNEYKNKEKIKMYLPNLEKNYKNITINNLDYKIYDSTNKLIKNLKSLNLSFNFNKTEKNIILINGRTGSGKSVLTRILAGFTESNNYKIYIDDEQINGFNEIDKSRILIGQKICEDYTNNSSICIKLNRLYPCVNNINELISYLHNFNIATKIIEKDLESSFSEKLSGGERQRVILSSMIWKVLKTNPRFIIIDEPEKGIDEETMCQIMDYIIKAYTGTIFLITHNETIKKRYSEKIQSRIEYKFDNNLYGEEVNTQIYQI